MRTSSGFVDFLRRLRVSATLAAILYVVLGIVLIAAPNAARGLLCLLVALGMTIYGVMSVVSYLVSHDDSFYAVDLLIGVGALAFGVFSLLNRTFLLNFLFIVLGLIGAVGSVGNISRAINLRKSGYPKWAIPLAPGIVTLLISLSVIFWPDLYGNMMMIVIGAMLVIEGVGDLFSIYQISHWAK